MEPEIDEGTPVLLVTVYLPHQVDRIQSKERIDVKEAYAMHSLALEADPGLENLKKDLVECAAGLRVIAEHHDLYLLAGEPEELYKASRELALRQRHANIMTLGEFLARQANAFRGETAEMQYPSGKPN